MLVVFHHLASYYQWHYFLWVPLQSFRMPLYYILSGLFFKEYNGMYDFILRKTNRLLIPFLFFYLLTSVPLTIIVQHRTFWDALIAFSITWDFENGCIWFLLSLFQVNALFYIIFKLFGRQNAWWLVVISLSFGCLGLMLSSYAIRYRCFFDTSLTVLPFFYFGYFLNHNTEYLQKKWNKVYVLCFIVIMSCFVFLFAAEQDFGLNRFSNYYVIYPCGIIGTIIVFEVAKCLKRVPLISYLGRYSIIVLCTHMLVMKPVRHLMSPFGFNEEISMWVNFIVTILSMLLVIPFCRSFVPSFTAQKDLIPLK